MKYFFTVFILLIIVLNIKALSDEDVFDIKFKKELINDNDWVFYIAQTVIGPFFIEGNLFCFIDNLNEFNYYNIDKEKRDKLNETVDDGILIKIGDYQYFQKNDKLYNIKPDKIEKTNNEVLLFDNYYFDYDIGVYKKEENKKEIIIENVKYNSYEYSFLNRIEYDKNEKAIYFLKRNENYISNNSYQLIKYDFQKNKKTLLFENVRSFSLIPNHPDYLILYAHGGEYNLNHQEFSGDFYILAKKDGKIIWNSDKKSYEDGVELVINTFDVNNWNEIVAIGAYMKIQDDKIIFSREEILLFDLVINKDKYNRIITNIRLTSINNLRLRKSDDINGCIIRNLKKGEKLKILHKGREENIDGLSGNWVKVETEKGEIGWCFDAYLEEVKE